VTHYIVIDTFNVPLTDDAAVSLYSLLISVKSDAPKQQCLVFKGLLAQIFSLTVSLSPPGAIRGREERH